MAEPVDLTVFKSLFISLRLPYSVKRFEQLSIVAVIFNYDKMQMEVCLIFFSRNTTLVIIIAICIYSRYIHFLMHTFFYVCIIN